MKEDIDYFYLTWKEREEEPIEHIIDYIRFINWGKQT